jgi:hypothetical protein
MDVVEMGWGETDWIYMAHTKGQWWAVVKTGNKLPVFTKY